MYMESDASEHDYARMQIWIASTELNLYVPLTHDPGDTDQGYDYVKPQALMEKAKIRR